MLAVARELRKSNVTVLTPDIYGPATIAGIEPDRYPFISILGTLIDQHSKLQKAYISMLWPQRRPDSCNRRRLRGKPTIRSWRRLAPPMATRPPSHFWTILRCKRASWHS